MSRRNVVTVGDARTVLDRLPAGTVDTVITSPPYFRLRNYGHDGQIGLEGDVAGWVQELRMVARGVARVLRPGGSLWLNLGDTYSRDPRQGAPTKSLIMAPERVALALIADGWTLRNKVIWSKTNPMPTSVRDRLACTWEVLYFFTREPRYHFDLDVIRVPHAGTVHPAQGKKGSWSVPPEWRGPSSGSNGGLERLKALGSSGHPLGKNPGDVWRLATAGFRGGHHAVFPEKLIEPALLATCPERVCEGCGAPGRRGPLSQGAPVPRPDCGCPEGTASRPGVVLDPFMGAGTTAVVAERHGRDWIGIELNPSIADLARQRIKRERNSRSLTTDPDQLAA